MADLAISNPFQDFGVAKPQLPLSNPFNDFGVKPKSPSAKPAVSNPMLDFQEDTSFQTGTPTPEPEKLTVDQLKADPERMAKLRKFMSNTKDVTFETAPADTVVENFLTHMRWVNANELSTGMEWMKVEAADEEIKALYGDAYRIHEELGSIFGNGANPWTAAKDYAGATLASPSTFFGLAIGKVGGVLATRAASKALIEGAKRASTPAIAKAIQEGTEAGVKAVAANQAKVKGGKVASSDLVRRELQNTAAKGAAWAQATGALAVEMPMATFQDYLYQDLMIQTGVQDDYSLLQGTLSTLAGGLGAIPTIGVIRNSANSTLADVEPLMKESYKARAASAGSRATPKIIESLNKAQTDWSAMVKAGQSVTENPELQQNLLDWFFNPRREDSVLRILLDEGAQFNTKENKLTEELLSFAYGLADDDLLALNKAFGQIGLKFGETVLIARNVLKDKTDLADAGDLVTATTNLGGKILQPVSEASRFVNAIGKASATKKKAGAVIDEAMENAAKQAKEGVTEAQPFDYALSTWKKLLVSNPVTTAANVVGFGTARFAQMLADTVSAAGFLGRAGIESVTSPSTGWKTAGKTRHLLANQAFAVRTMFDPFLSAGAFFKFLDNAPSKIQDKIASQIYGGVDNFGPEKFGINPNNKVVKGLEFYGDIAQISSFVHVQDTLTKGISGLTALDKQSRMNFGKGIEQLVLDGEAWKLTTDMWDDVAKTVLRETFSEDFGVGKAWINRAARFGQQTSQHPLFGYYYPFGNFMNNVLSFSYRYSPIPLVVHAPKIFGRAITGKNPVEGIEDLMAKSVVGTSALIMTAQHEGAKQEEGLQWFEERNNDGSIDNISTLFPQNVLNLMGRITYNINQGEGMDLGLVDEFRKATGVLDVLEMASAPDWFQALAKVITEPREPMDGVEDYFKYVGDVVGAGAVEAGKVIIGGATRPFAPTNAMMSLTDPNMGGGVQPDPKQSEGLESFVVNSTRNINSFFNFAFGEETESGVRLYGKPKESATSTGPVKMVNPLGAVQGGNPQSPATALNKVLGMVNKQPFRVDSFTSGNAEYDAFINRNVTPLLEKEAQKLLKDPIFMQAPMSVKMERVGQVITGTRDTIIELIEGNYLGPNARILNERRKLLTMPAAARSRAKEAAGITTEDKSLSLWEIEQIRIHMELDKLKYGLSK